MLPSVGGEKEGTCFLLEKGRVQQCGRVLPGWAGRRETQSGTPNEQCPAPSSRW